MFVALFHIQTHKYRVLHVVKMILITTIPTLEGIQKQIEYQNEQAQDSAQKQQIDMVYTAMHEYLNRDKVENKENNDAVRSSVEDHNNEADQFSFINFC